MIVKCFAIAAAVFFSTGAAAKPLTSRAGAVAQTRTVAARTFALEKIIGQVQLDALIDQIVSSDEIAATTRRGVAYANIGSTRLRNRS